MLNTIVREVSDMMCVRDVSPSPLSGRVKPSWKNVAAGVNDMLPVLICSLAIDCFGMMVPSWPKTRSFMVEFCLNPTGSALVGQDGEWVDILYNDSANGLCQQITNPAFQTTYVSSGDYLNGSPFYAIKSADPNNIEPVYYKASGTLGVSGPYFVPLGRLTQNNPKKVVHVQWVGAEVGVGPIFYLGASPYVMENENHSRWVDMRVMNAGAFGYDVNISQVGAVQVVPNPPIGAPVLPVSSTGSASGSMRVQGVANPDTPVWVANAQPGDETIDVNGVANVEPSVRSRWLPPAATTTTRAGPTAQEAARHNREMHSLHGNGQDTTLAEMRAYRLKYKASVMYVAESAWVGDDENPYAALYPKTKKRHAVIYEETENLEDELNSDSDEVTEPNAPAANSPTDREARRDKSSGGQTGNVGGGPFGARVGDRKQNPRDAVEPKGPKTKPKTTALTVEEKAANYDSMVSRIATRLSGLEASAVVAWAAERKSLAIVRDVCKRL